MIFLIAFIGAITPGPDILLILQTTLRFGIKKALITLFGIASGWIFYLAILYFGFAHFFTSNFAQIILSIFGIIYLLYLSFLLYKNKSNDLDFKNSKVVGGYKRGLLINLSNPKAILFFCVIVTPYMDKNMLFNLTFLFLGLFSAFLSVIFIAAYFRRFITNKLFNVIDKICAFIFLIFVVILAIRLFVDLL